MIPVAREQPAAVAEPARCRNHPANPAVVDCTSCGHPICEVCRFSFATGSYCPACATAMARAGSGRTPASAILSVVLAFIGFVVVLGLMVVGMTGGDKQGPFLILASVVWLACSAGGLASGFVARDRQRGHSLVATLGVVANSVLLGLLCIAMVVGMVMG